MHTRIEQARLYMLVLVFSAGILYGTTYQQFRYFNLDDHGGAADAILYVEMSKGSRRVERVSEVFNSEHDMLVRIRDTEPRPG